MNLSSLWNKILKSNRTSKRKAVKKPKPAAKRRVKNKVKTGTRKRTVSKSSERPQRKAGKVKSKTKPQVATRKIKKPKEIGAVTHYFDKIEVGIIKLKAPLNRGDKIRIQSAQDSFEQKVESLQIDHKDISRAPRGAEVGVKVRQKVREHAKVYKVV